MQISTSIFNFYKTKRPLFLDQLESGKGFILFSLSKSGDSFKLGKQLQYYTKHLTIISFLHDPGILTFNDATIKDKETYGREWFVLRAI